MPEESKPKTGGPYQPGGKVFFWVGTLGGVMLIALAWLSSYLHMGTTFPYGRLLMACGLAAFFAALSSSATIRLTSETKTPSYVASGGVAIAILLIMLIGPDPQPPQVPMTYNVQFLDTTSHPSPDDLEASVRVIRQGQTEPEPALAVHVGRNVAGGPNLILPVFSNGDRFIIDLWTKDRSHSWQSATMLFNESFMFVE